MIGIEFWTMIYIQVNGIETSKYDFGVDNTQGIYLHICTVDFQFAPKYKTFYDAKIFEMTTNIA